jgi:hypothetical protein
MKRLAWLCLVAACSSSSSDEKAPDKLADLQYAGPTGWSHKDTKEISRSIARWIPGDNSRKESISIIRTSARGVKGAALPQLESMLSRAQSTLPTPALSQPRPNQTKQNLQEVEITADFVPAGMSVSYHRVHAMIVDGDALIHVLYTARTPDPDLAMFHQVVDTIRRGEG